MMRLFGPQADVFLLRNSPAFGPAGFAMPILFRLWKVFSVLLGVFTISVYAVGSFEALFQPHILPQFLRGMFSLFLLLCAGYLMNDLCDLPHDLINRPEKVFIGKVVKPQAAKYISLVLFVAGLALGIGVNSSYAATIFVIAAGLALYNLYSKRFGILKDIAISLIVISIYPISLSLTSGGTPSLRRTSLFIFPVWLFLTIMAYEIVRDIVDAPGDSIAQERMVILKADPLKSRQLAVLLALGGLPFALVPFLLNMCGTVYLAGYVGATSVLGYGITAKNELFSIALFSEIMLITVSSLLDVIFR